MDKQKKSVVFYLLIIIFIIVGAYVGAAYFIDTNLWLPWREQESNCSTENVGCPGGKGYKTPIPSCKDEECTVDLCCVSNDTPVGVKTCESVTCEYGYTDKTKRCGNNIDCDEYNCCSQKDYQTCQSVYYTCTNGNSVTHPNNNLSTSEQTDEGKDQTCGCNDEEQPETCADFNCGDNLINKTENNNIECEGGSCTFETCCESKKGKCAGYDATDDESRGRCSKFNDDKEGCTYDNKCIYCSDIYPDDHSCTKCIYVNSQDDSTCSDLTHPVKIMDPDIYCGKYCGQENQCCRVKYCMSNQEQKKISKGSNCSTYKREDENGLCSNLYWPWSSETSSYREGNAKTCGEVKSGAGNDAYYKCTDDQKTSICQKCDKGWSEDGMSCTSG